MHRLFGIRPRQQEVEPSLDPAETPGYGCGRPAELSKSSLCQGI